MAEEEEADIRGAYGNLGLYSASAAKRLLIPRAPLVLVSGDSFP